MLCDRREAGGSMSGFRYDEDASATWRMDVVHDVEDPPSRSRWVEAMRRLNAIDDPLARKVLALHRECGSGTGPCDDTDDDPLPSAERTTWGCATTEIVASHFGVVHP